MGHRREVSLRFDVLALLGFALPEAFPFPGLGLSASFEVQGKVPRPGTFLKYPRGDRKVKAGEGEGLREGETQESQDLETEGNLTSDPNQRKA